jgi:hypothetical protein
MIDSRLILPGTGRGTSRRLVEGVRRERAARGAPPSTTGLRPAVPLPASGEDRL